MIKLVKESLSRGSTDNIHVGDILYLTLPTTGKWDIEIKDIYYDGIMNEVIFEFTVDNTEYKQGEAYISTHTTQRKSFEAFKKNILPFIN